MAQSLPKVIGIHTKSFEIAKEVAQLSPEIFE
jgi:hypothetical protein